MAQFTQVLGAPKNRLLIDGVEVDLFKKKATIDSYSKSQWDSTDISSSKTTIRDAMVLYHGELHFIGASSDDSTVGMHCKFDGTTWTSNVSTLPYNPSYCNAIVFNDEIHIFGGGKNAASASKDLSTEKYHYKWNDTDGVWTKVSSLPYYFFNGSVVIINGQIHILGGGRTKTTKKKHYYYNGKSWKKGASLPLMLSGLYQAVLSHDNYYEDYLIVYGSNGKDYVWNVLRLLNNKWILTGGSNFLSTPTEIPKMVMIYNGSLWRYEYNSTNTYDKIIFGQRNRITYTYSTKIYDDYIGFNSDYLSNPHMIFFKGKLYLFGENGTNKITKSSLALYTLEIEDK